jgi:uncharacterized RDD family membrane protein YckC
VGIEYPGLLRRYFSTVIDGLFIIFMIILSGYIFDSKNHYLTNIRVGIILFMFFVYEPYCTSFLCTLGQKITGIRVRKSYDYEKINLIQAYIREIVKIFLGIISFFTIPFSKNKRAIHDMAVGSIVIYKR